MANSINTNAAALVALQNLTAVSNDLEDTQTTISTGFEVFDASVIGAIFSIAEGLRGELGVRESIGSQLGFSASTVGVALAGAESVSTNLNTFLATVTDLGNGALSTANQNLLISRLEDIVLDISASVFNAASNGINLIGGPASAVQQNVSIVGNVDGTTILVSAGFNIAGQDFSSFAVEGDEFSGFNNFINILSAAVGDLRSLAGNTGSDTVASAAAALISGDTSSASTFFGTDTAASGRAISAEEVAQSITNFRSAVGVVLNTLGSVSTRLDGQVEFNQALSDATEVGLGALVDADLARESAELQALQVQQSLASTSLTIANGAPAILLGLF